MKFDLTQYRKTFFDEARDHLAAIETALLRLDGADPGAIDDAFRAAHSIKGGADAVGFPHIAKYTHGLEETFDRFRGADRIPRTVLDRLLEATDTLGQLVNAARAGEVPPAGTDDVFPWFAAAVEQPEGPPAVDRRTFAVTVIPHPDAMRFGLDPLALLRGLTELGTVGRVELNASGLPPLADLDPERCYLSWIVYLETDRPEVEIADVFAFASDMVQATIAPVEAAVRAETLKATSIEVFDPVRIAALLARPEPDPEPAPVPERAEEPRPDVRPDPAPGPRRGADKETVRVDKDRLDKLINTIGELVIAQSMAQQEFDAFSAGSASRALPELAKIARDLQELGLSLRMVPLRGTFQKMTRLVRDLSRKLGKPVELALHGEETELDKTVVDRLGDPLMHMVRNALDHGLESPADRALAGKPADGHLALRAYHQGGNVYIELTDDGRGLDRARLLRKAIEKGIVAEGERLSDAEVYALIFEPGFSTAAGVTDVSGRGVGMDVVRRNVQALQGNILIRTQPGKGTTFTIRLPLTLAIVDGLTVGLGEDVYVLPLLSVIESFRPRPADVRTIAARGEAITVRGEVVPLVRLHQLLDRPCRDSDPCRGLVVLVEDQGKKHAILVDELLGQMQAVVKSLDANYRRVEGFAGATILGDGRVAMILDIHGLVQLHARLGRGKPPAVLAVSAPGELL